MTVFFLKLGREQIVSLFEKGNPKKSYIVVIPRSGKPHPFGTGPRSK